MDTAQRRLLEQVLDKAASDATFRNDLLDDPQAALKNAGLMPAPGDAGAVQARETEPCEGRTCFGVSCSQTCTNTCSDYTCALHMSY